MQSVKSYLGLPDLRLPGWAELKDGSFLTRALKKTQASPEVSVIKDFEGKLVKVQEVAVWSNPGVSLAWVLVTQAGLFYVTTVTSTSLVSGLAYSLLSLYLYLTWVYTVWPAVRVPPKSDEDSETFTPVHPDVMSAPEMEAVFKNCKSRLYEIVSGLMLLRQEQPGKFCAVISIMFLMMAMLGTKVTWAILLHTGLLALLVIPALVTRAGRHEQLSLVLETLSDCLSSLLEIITYRGKDVPVEACSSKLIEEFVPDTSKETTSLLSKALNSNEKPDKEAEYTLTENVSIPSHEEIENDSLTNLHKFEQGLQPPVPKAVELSNYSDSEAGDKCRAEDKHFNDNDTEESLDLEQELSRSLNTETGELGQSAASSAAAASEGTVSSVRAPDFEEDLRLSLTAAPKTHQRRSSDLDDFEIIDEDELDL